MEGWNDVSSRGQSETDSLKKKTAEFGKPAEEVQPTAEKKDDLKSNIKSVKKQRKVDVQRRASNPRKSTDIDLDFVEKVRIVDKILSPHTGGGWNAPDQMDKREI